MEPTEGTHFKHVPVHLYQSGSSAMTQTLVKPVSDDGNHMTLGELIKLNYPSIDNRKLKSRINSQMKLYKFKML